MPKTYGSVLEMLKGLNVDEASLALYKTVHEEHSVGRNLFVIRNILKLRKVKGLSKAEMERIEGSKNSELCMADVGKYLEGFINKPKEKSCLHT